MAKQQTDKAGQLLNVYNMVANLVWSALSFAPVVVFCYCFVPPGLTVLFAGSSLLALVLPTSFFKKIQVSQSTRIYKKLRVDFVKTVSQNGGLVHRLLRKRYPGYKAVTTRPLSISRILELSHINEKFHFTTAVFFILLIFYALWTHLLWWAILLGFLNLFYNVYPILLQQYIRLKLRSARKNRDQKIGAKQSRCRMFLHRTR